MSEQEKYPREWEVFTTWWNNGHYDVARLKVFGGWIVQVEASHNPCFVPDPDHKWVLEEEK